MGWIPTIDRSFTRLLESIVVPMTRKSLNLSLESMVDVFMNALGVVMLMGLGLALAPVTNKISSDSSSTKEATDTNQSVLKYKIPVARHAASKPFFVYVDADGYRTIDADPRIEQRYFSSTSYSNAIVYTPIGNAITSISEIEKVVFTLDKNGRHAMILLAPNGLDNYERIVNALTAQGFSSGWLPLQSKEVVFSSTGRSTKEVQ